MFSVRKFWHHQKSSLFRHPLRFTNVIIPAKCMTQLWFQQFCCPAGPTGATRKQICTVLWFCWTVMWFPLPISNTRWRESNRVCKRERVWQWLEYLLGHCSWLCISPHFWMGIFSSQVQHYYRRWLEINNKSSEGSLKPHQLCSLIHCLLDREKLWNSGLCFSFIEICEFVVSVWWMPRWNMNIKEKKYMDFKVNESWKRTFLIVI